MIIGVHALSPNLPDALTPAHAPHPLPLTVQLAKPIKARTSPEMYTYFTWGVLLYTCVKMW